MFIEKVKDFYRNFDETDLSRLGDLYDAEAVFTDPLHSISGLEAIEHYFQAGRKGLISCQFDYRTSLVCGNSAVLEWDMHFAHRRLKRGNLIVVSGCSVFDLDGRGERIIKHVDYYDLGQMLYEHLPVLGFVLKKIKHQVVSP